MGTISEVLKAQKLPSSWGVKFRRDQLKEIEALRERNTAALAESKPLEYIYRAMYMPDRGMFCDAPADLGIGDIQIVRVKASSLAFILDILIQNLCAEKGHSMYPNRFNTFVVISMYTVVQLYQVLPVFLKMVFKGVCEYPGRK